MFSGITEARLATLLEMIEEKERHFDIGMIEANGLLKKHLVNVQEAFHKYEKTTADKTALKIKKGIEAATKKLTQERDDALKMAGEAEQKSLQLEKFIVEYEESVREKFDFKERIMTNYERLLETRSCENIVMKAKMEQLEKRLHKALGWKVEVDEDAIENETMPPLIDITDLNEEELLGVASRKTASSIASYVVLGMEGEQSELSELDMID